LDAAYLRMMMGLEGNKQPLYAGVLMGLLRDVQRSGRRPSWADFLGLIKKAGFSRDQSGPLQQRVEMLEGLVLESGSNASLAGASSYTSLMAEIEPGSLVICDLTDPMLSPD
ncbi:hypothetical protein KIPB_015269, partial [Kipferlia bialata]